MNNTTVRAIGVISLVLFIVTIGFAAAQAAQPPDASLIPTVVTDRPLTSAEPSGTLPGQEATPLPVVTGETTSTKPTPTQTTNTGSSGQRSSGGHTSSDASADSDREVVKRSVRDDDHDEDKVKSESDSPDEDKVKSESDRHDEKKTDSTEGDKRTPKVESDAQKTTEN
jgi:hypothetical protein